MQKYVDKNGDSGISDYEYDNNQIKIKFKFGKTYTYPSSKVGLTHFNNMRKLADAGDGLNAYINTNPEVKKGYSVIE